MSNYATASCDVLVLGGGIGGLSCAVATKEALPEADVLVVEKNFAGYAGKANRGGGVLQYFDPEKVDPMGFAYFHTKNIGADLSVSLPMRRKNLFAKLQSCKSRRNRHGRDPTLRSWGVSLTIRFVSTPIFVRHGVSTNSHRL